MTTKADEFFEKKTCLSDSTLPVDKQTPPSSSLRTVSYLFSRFLLDSGSISLGASSALPEV